MDDPAPHSRPAAEPPAGSFATDLVGHPVIQTLVVMVVVSTATWVGSFAGLSRLFVLAPPVFSPPWTLVTSVYAHIGPGHLVSNAILIALAGGIVSLSTTRLRFHLFFLGTGVLAGVVQVLVFTWQGRPIAVLGASGAAFALVGYVLAANPAAAALRSLVGVPVRILVVVVAFVAAALTMWLSAPGSALLAHFTGATLGLLAGWRRLLDAT